MGAEGRKDRRPRTAQDRAGLRERCSCLRHSWDLSAHARASALELRDWQACQACCTPPCWLAGADGAAVPLPCPPVAGAKALAAALADGRAPDLIDLDLRDNLQIQEGGTLALVGVLARAGREQPLVDPPWMAG